MPVIPALGEYRQEDQKFKSSLGCFETLSLEKTKLKPQRLLSSALLGPPGTTVDSDGYWEVW